MTRWRDEEEAMEMDKQTTGMYSKKSFWRWELFFVVCTTLSQWEGDKLVSLSGVFLVVTFPKFVSCLPSSHWDNQ